MLGRGEKVAVAISGGKDSITTLYILADISDAMNLELQAIAVDEGISSYRRKTIKTAKKFCSSRGVPLHILSFQESFGKTLDEMVDPKTACTYCGVLRRKLLNDKSRELECDKLATGHNLDDEVQAIMMNYVRGDLERLIRLQGGSCHHRFIPRIKPLLEMPEKEVALYTILKKFDTSFDECPYSRDSFRGEIRDFIYSLEKNNPGIKFSILKGYQKLLQHLTNYTLKDFSKCEVCGDPTSGNICKACQILKII
jgi:uncharacterized protein (TIGR00269 family)